MIVPTIGRRVWFFPGKRDGILRITADQPCDAGVAYVHNDRLVNLSVADHNGQIWPRAHVALLQDDDQPPADGSPYATWMPYQKGQAAKVSEGA